MAPPTPPTPRLRELPKPPLSEGEKLSRALLQILRESGYFKTVSRDIIQEEILPENLLPAVVFDEVRTRLEWMDQHNRGRYWEARGTITLDVQGVARSHREREIGFDLSSMRSALAHAVLLVMANNNGLVTRLEDAGEEAAEKHCISIAQEVDVQHIPTAPPFTRSLISVSVHYVEANDLRAWREWSGRLFEAAPHDGATTETPAWEATTGIEK